MTSSLLLGRMTEEHIFEYSLGLGKTVVRRPLEQVFLARSHTNKPAL